MTPPSPTSLDDRPAPSAALWNAPRVTPVAIARPGVDVDPGASGTFGAIEWLPRSSADRRL